MILISTIIGFFSGCLVGFTVGIAQAVLSRDGIFPLVWAGLILFGGSVGAAIGLLAGLVRWFG